MTINTKVNLCNMALGSLGNYGTINDIDTPTNDKERTYKLWYDICRQFTLKLMMPNFALAKKIVAKSGETPAFGYGFFYEYPTDCLKVLGIGDVKDKQNNYAVERCSTGLAIATDDDFEDGLELRYIKDVEIVSEMSVEYKMLLSQYLAAYTCLTITQDPAKTKALMEALPAQMSVASGLNAQENRPIRMSRSRFKAARNNHDPDYTDKK